MFFFFAVAILVPASVVATCMDTPDWKNVESLRDEHDYFDCRLYQDRGFCKDGGFVAGFEWTGKKGYTEAGKCEEKDCGEYYNQPGDNCCACGGGSDKCACPKEHSTCYMGYLGDDPDFACWDVDWTEENGKWKESVDAACGKCNLHADATVFTCANLDFDACGYGYLRKPKTNNSTCAGTAGCDVGSPTSADQDTCCISLVTPTCPATIDAPNGTEATCDQDSFKSCDKFSKRWMSKWFCKNEYFCTYYYDNEDKALPCDTKPDSEEYPKCMCPKEHPICFNKDDGDKKADFKCWDTDDEEAIVPECKYTDMCALDFSVPGTGGDKCECSLDFPFCFMKDNGDEKADFKCYATDDDDGDDDDDDDGDDDDSWSAKLDCGACTGNYIPTCSDKALNGDETGVDCGGDSCPVCGCLDTKWTDSDGDNCERYVADGHCTPDKRLESNFAGLAVDGVDALDACCGCGSARPCCASEEAKCQCPEDVPECHMKEFKGFDGKADFKCYDHHRRERAALRCGDCTENYDNCSCPPDYPSCFMKDEGDEKADFKCWNKNNTKKIVLDCGQCKGNYAAFAMCSDATMNGDETGIDCGGSCPSCVDKCACPPLAPVCFMEDAGDTKADFKCWTTDDTNFLVPHCGKCEASYDPCRCTKEHPVCFMEELRPGKIAKALYDYTPEDGYTHLLKFQAGDGILIVAQDNTEAPDWWMGKLNGLEGLFLSSYVDRTKPDFTCWDTADTKNVVLGCGRCDGNYVAPCECSVDFPVCFMKDAGDTKADFTCWDTADENSITPGCGNCNGNYPTCSDRAKNGDERGVDCGGSCPPCPTVGPTTATVGPTTTTVGPTTAPTEIPLPLLEVTLVMETKPSEEQQQTIKDDFCTDFGEANGVAVELVVCEMKFADARRRLLEVTATLSVAVAPDADPVEAAKIPVVSADVITKMATKVMESVKDATGESLAKAPIGTVPTKSPTMAPTKSPAAAVEPTTAGSEEFSGGGTLEVPATVAALTLLKLVV